MQLGEVIEPDSRGLNTYQDAHNIYFAAALKRKPNVCNLMCLLGFTKDELDLSTCVESDLPGYLSHGLAKARVLRG